MTDKQHIDFIVATGLAIKELKHEFSLTKPEEVHVGCRIKITKMLHHNSESLLSCNIKMKPEQKSNLIFSHLVLKLQFF